MNLSFFVEGIPRPQPRPRAVVCKGRVRMFTPKSVRGWRDAVYLAALARKKDAGPIAEPVELTVDFFFSRRKRDNETAATSPMISRPDIDNLAKAAMDAMTEAGLWLDDAQIFSLRTSKWFTNGSPGAAIEVRYEWPNRR